MDLMCHDTLKSLDLQVVAASDGACFGEQNLYHSQRQPGMDWMYAYDVHVAFASRFSHAFHRFK